MADETVTSTEAVTAQTPAPEATAAETTFTAPGAEAPAETPVTEKPPEKPAVTDSPAAIKLAAKASKEARDARKALEATQKELADLKAAGGTGGDSQKMLDEIKVNPGKLLGLGLTADQILKAVLDPDGTPKEADPAIKALSEEVAALKAKNEAESKAAAEREEAAKKEQESAVTKRAHEKVAGHITSFAEEFPFVDADDTVEITDAIVDWCDKNNYKIRGDDDVKHFVKQAAEQLNAKREKRFGPRVAKKQDVQRGALNGGIGFTDSKKPPLTATSKPSAPTSLSTSTDPLPTPKKHFEIGFTK